MPRYHIGIDDTDNAQSRGTGFRARQLAAALAAARLARVRGVSRHQLFVHPDIPYTSHNSALCLDVEMDASQRDGVIEHCRAYLAAHAAPGSDAAFCVAAAEAVSPGVVAWGGAAKRRVLSAAAAHELAAPELHLEGVTGDRGGVIGALAAVGLRRGGHDGRFVWVEGVRELDGVTTAAALLERTGIDVIRTLDGELAGPGDRIRVEPWPRPVLLEDRAVLLVQRMQTRENANERIDWQLLPRDVVRRY